MGIAGIGVFLITISAVTFVSFVYVLWGFRASLTLTVGGLWQRCRGHTEGGLARPAPAINNPVYEAKPASSNHKQNAKWRRKLAEKLGREPTAQEMHKYVAKKEKAKTNKQQAPAVDGFGFGPKAEIDAGYLNVASDAGEKK